MEKAKWKSPSFWRRRTKCRLRQPFTERAKIFSSINIIIFILICSQASLSILQYKMRKSRDQVIMSFFDNPRILTYNIIAIQEPWRNLEIFTTYHLNKNVIHLIYMKYASTKVCCYISNQIAISSWNSIHYNPDLYIIQLKVPSLNKLHIHNIYNLISSSYSSIGQLAML